MRLYYDPAKKSHPTGRIISPGHGDAPGLEATLEAEAFSSSAARCIAQRLSSCLVIEARLTVRMMDSYVCSWLSPAGAGFDP